MTRTGTPRTATGEAPGPGLRTDAELAHALRPAIMRLARRLRQMREDGLELNANQLSAMGVLLTSGDLPMGELAAAEMVQPPSMTRIVNGLEERGLVTRRADAHDRRSSRVSLTDAGRQVLLALRRRRDQWLAIRIAELDEREREVLRACVPVLEKVYG